MKTQQECTTPASQIGGHEIPDTIRVILDQLESAAYRWPGNLEQFMSAAGIAYLHVWPVER